MKTLLLSGLKHAEYNHFRHQVLHVHLVEGSKFKGTPASTEVVIALTWTHQVQGDLPDRNYEELWHECDGLSWERAVRCATACLAERVQPWPLSALSL